MSDDKPKDDREDAVDKIADAIKIAIKGYPVYGIVIGILWGYGELWLDKKISDAIATKTLEVPAVVTMTGAVQANTNAVNELKNEVGTIKGDTTAILLHLAGRPSE